MREAIKRVGMNVVYLPIILVAVALSACSTPEPGSPEARMETTANTVDEMPEWYLKLPKDTSNLYASGSSTSPDIQLAMDKAVLMAKRSLADRINSQLSSKMKDFITETGQGSDTGILSEIERVTTNLITNVNVSGYSQNDAKVVQQGSNYRAFVLLQHPNGNANRVLVEEVKKSPELNSKLRASKAFKELEEDIKNAQ